jgi:hypothetical protein
MSPATPGPARERGALQLAAIATQQLTWLASKGRDLEFRFFGCRSRLMIAHALLAAHSGEGFSEIRMRTRRVSEGTIQYGFHSVSSPSACGHERSVSIAMLM